LAKVPLYTNLSNLLTCLDTWQACVIMPTYDFLNIF
jgi:hypothetical protein